VWLARIEGRGVDVHDEPGAGQRLRAHRPVREPDVLADRDADLDAADEEERGFVARLEVAVLIEYAVVRQ
jgi:hypothetical protein